jgi:serine/threonine-protein kinase HipA
MDEKTCVYVDSDGPPELVGVLWSRVRKGHESATFEYQKTWLENPKCFSLEPALMLGPGPYHTDEGKALFGAIGDSAPDRWGRVLMRRAERRLADIEHRAPRTLREIDYLLMVDDEARQGALRFAQTEGGAFVRAGAEERIPPLVVLPRLLAAAEHFGEENETQEDIRLLLAPGSSLGGARPKASVRGSNGQLVIAKFPHKMDETNAVLWEALALKLAAKAGITVASWRLEKISAKSVLLLQRFDREGKRRLPFLSAMSMLGARDREAHSYLEVVDALRQHGAQVKDDLEQLWRRIIFYILISNTDDHLRNLGFLYRGRAGWSLSPAYDLNPVPVELKPRVLTTNIDLDDGTASLDLALSVAEYFNLTSDHAKAVTAEVAKGVALWRREASALGISRTEIDEMSSAFDHADFKQATKLGK